MAVRQVKLTLLAALTGLVLSGCGDEPTSPFRFQTVVVTPSGSFPGGRGATTRFTATVVNQLGEPLSNEGFGWTFTSSDPTVIEITPTGLATARGVGSAQITARAGSFEGTTPSTVAQVPTAVVPAAGNNQSGVVGKPLSTPITVRVVDAGGAAMVGRPVRFSVTGGGGLISVDSVTTGADGLAKTTWTLGTSTSAPQRLTAASQDISVVLNATARSDVPTVVTAAAGVGQTGWALEPLDTAVAVLVADRFGNPVQGAGVTWQVVDGGGSVSGTSVPTDVAGRSRTTWTLGATSGLQTLRAEPVGLSPVVFTATAQPNAVITGAVSVVSGLLTPPAAAVQRRPESAPEARVPGEWIVTFDAAAESSPAAAAGFTARLVAPPVSALRERAEALRSVAAFAVVGVSPAVRAVRVRVADAEAWDAVGRALRAQPGVQSVEPNRLLPVNAGARIVSVLPTDQDYPFQAWHYEAIGLDQAWKVTTGSPSVLVAVLDDGVRFDHPNLAPNLTADGYDFVTDQMVPACTGGSYSNAGDGGGPDADPTTPPAHPYFPATACAGIVSNIAGGVQAAGIVGAAQGTSHAVGVTWSVKIRPVRVIGAAGVASDYDVAQGLLYAAGLPADNGAGGTVTAPSRAQIIDVSVAASGAPTSVMTAAVQSATGTGALLIAPVGDAGTSDPRYPAAFPQVLSVAAAGPGGTLAPYSSFPSTVDIAAPGGDRSTDLTRGVYSTLWDFGTGVPSWGFGQGSALAAAHVAGVAALVLAREPSLTGSQLFDRLRSYAAPTAGLSALGIGQVDAFASVRKGVPFNHDVYVRVVSATTGEIVRTVKASANGSFRASRLPLGAYRVYAGQDEEGDTIVGVPGRAWGGLGGAASNTILSTPATGVYVVSLSIGMPVESGNNRSMLSGDRLPLGGYLDAELKSGEEDWYTVTVPAGSYTFGTAGWTGACGLALQANTRVDLYDAAGSPLAGGDDGSGNDFCGRVTMSLPGGTYSVRVTGSMSVPYRTAGQVVGLYRVFVR